jgi:four helix bundle protein
MKIMLFEDITTWQKSQELAILLYKEFKGIHDFGFKNQLLRAAVSISNNIAEGFERNSDKDFSKYLHISKGSCSEVKSMIYLSENLNNITIEKSKIYLENCSEITRIINGLIKSLNNSITK